MLGQAVCLRTRARFAAAFVALLVIAACTGDKAIRSLDKGISKDSTLKLLGASGTDTFHNVYDYGNYILNGQALEILYYDSDNRKFRRDTVKDVRKEITPIVLVNQKVAGWGWPFADSVAGANAIQLAK
jgi:hypothetical protein